MKLKIRYENEVQIIELDAKATEEMWVSLSLEGEGLSQAEREELIQKEWNEQFNKDDYNNWHKFNRHRGYSKAVPDEETDEVDCSEPLMSEVKDPRIFCRQELEKDKQYDYEACCDRIRAAVKPAQADMLIVILSRLVNTFISRISLTMLPVPNSHNTVCVLSGEEARHWQSRSSGYSSS